MEPITGNAFRDMELLPTHDLTDEEKAKVQAIVTKASARKAQAAQVAQSSDIPPTDEFTAAVCARFGQENGKRLAPFLWSLRGTINALFSAPAKPAQSAKGAK